MIADFNRCLITGATGFVGSHLARQLVNNGKEVHVLVRSQSSLNSINDIVDKITLHQIDTTTGSVINALGLAKPDIVFHLAALFKAAHTPDDIQSLIDSNITFTAQLLEGMKQAGTDALINTGTAWQHYQNADYDPVCLYAATKQAAEDLITFYCNAYGLRSITLMLFDTYGSGDTRKKLFHLLREALNASSPLRFSPGQQHMDLLHIDDVVTAFQVAAELAMNFAPQMKESYQLTSGVLPKLRDIANCFEQLAGRPVNIAWGALPYRAREMMVPWTGGKRLPGWTPKITLEAGISRLLREIP